VIWGSATDALCWNNTKTRSANTYLLLKLDIQLPSDRGKRTKEFIEMRDSTVKTILGNKQHSQRNKKSVGYKSTILEWFGFALTSFVFAMIYTILFLR
jgi:hypothetical protein